MDNGEGIVTQIVAKANGDECAMTPYIWTVLIDLASSLFAYTVYKVATLYVASSEEKTDENKKEMDKSLEMNQTKTATESGSKPESANTTDVGTSPSQSDPWKSGNDDIANPFGDPFGSEVGGSDAYGGGGGSALNGGGNNAYGGDNGGAYGNGDNAYGGSAYGNSGGAYS